MRQNIWTVILIVLLFTITGCGKSEGDSNRYSTQKYEIAQALKDFKSAVEEYNVELMLAMFNKDTTESILTIQEGSFSYSKNYSTLKAELEEDETNQLTWRKDPDQNVSDRHGYALRMELGTLSYSNMSESGGYATQTFEIYESAVNPPIAETKTDSGAIIWKMAMTTGQWKAVSMTINFNTNASLSNTIAQSRISSISHGFGFGKVYTNYYTNFR